MEYTSVSPAQRTSRAKTAGLIALAVVGTLVATYAVFNTVPAKTEFLLLNSLTDPSSLVDDFSKWKSTHGHSFSALEDSKRFSIFSQTDKKINDHNAGGHSWQMGHNQFSHLSAEEFVAGNTGAKPDNAAQSRRLLAASTVSTTSYPSSWNWTAQGAVTAVKNQGGCGSCWSFSASGALEGLEYLKTKKLVALSEQQLVSCSGGQWGNGGCNGGWMASAFQYVIDRKGISTEAAYPYTSGGGVVSNCSDQSINKTLIIGYNGTKSYTYTTGNNATALLQAIYGRPVSVALDATPLQSYSSGIINTTCTTNINHGVLAVGYNTASGANHTHGYYIVKNSWSSGWGEKGYFRIAITGNDAGMCGIQQWGMYPTA